MISMCRMKGPGENEVMCEILGVRVPAHALR